MCIYVSRANTRGLEELYNKIQIEISVFSQNVRNCIWFVLPSQVKP